MTQFKIIIENGLIQSVLTECSEPITIEVIDLDLPDNEYNNSLLNYATWLQNNESWQETEITNAFCLNPVLSKHQFEANLAGLRVIHYFSIMNPWIDFLIACHPNDFYRAQQAIQRGMCEFWNDDDLCFGDTVMATLKEEHIFFYLCYADLTEDGLDTTQDWNDWASNIVARHQGEECS